ncbi:MAG: LamG domain-containing protein [Anaerolineae bacterium]|nr:LamG domain-containing protein [Phycisphaerae bacterium]
MLRSKTIYALTALCLGGTFAPVNAAIVGPYTTDTNTLHLYHLDETAVNFIDSGSAATLRDLDVLTSPATSAASLTGFTNAGSFTADTASQIQQSIDTVQSEWQDATSGAFTYEAIINPSGITGIRTILSKDHTTGGPNRRSFIFRLNGTNLELIRTGPTVQTISIAVPTVGANAIAAGTWFHVAVTYDGVDNTTGNTTLYWTKMDAANTAANAIGTANNAVDIGSVGGNTPFTIGNRDDATTANNSFGGLIDEVRVSNIARGSQGMQFVPEPASLSAIALGGLLLGRRRRI